MDLIVLPSLYVKSKNCNSTIVENRNFNIPIYVTLHSKKPNYRREYIYHLNFIKYNRNYNSNCSSLLCFDDVDFSDSITEYNISIKLIIQSENECTLLEDNLDYTIDESLILLREMCLNREIGLIDEVVIMNDIIVSNGEISKINL